MKNLLPLLCCMFTFGVFGQELQELGTVTINTLGKTFVGIDGHTKYYHEQNDAYKNAKHTYYIHDIASGESREVDLGTVESGDYAARLIDAIYWDGHIYELQRFVKSSITTSCKVGIIKRRSEDLSQVGDVVWLGEYGIFNAMESPTIWFEQGETGLFVISGKQGHGDQICFAAKYDKDLSQLWKTDLAILGDEKVSYEDCHINDNDDILLTLKVDPEETKGWSFTNRVSSVGLLFANISKEGEVAYVSPDLSSEIYVSNVKFNYDSRKKELSAVFLISKLVNANSETSEGLGYNFYRWNSDGEILADHKHYFSLEEFKKNGLSDEYIKSSGLSTDDIIAKSGDLITVRGVNDYMFPVEFHEDGSCLVMLRKYDLRTSQGYPIDDIWGSSILFSLKASGEMKWMQFMPGTKMLTPNATMIDRGETIYVISKEYRVNFENGAYNFEKASTMVTPSSVVPAIRTIDAATGEIQSYQPLIEEEQKKFTYASTEKGFTSDKDLMYVVYMGRKKSRKYFQLKL